MYLPGTTDLTKDAQAVPNPESARPKRDEVSLDGRRILDIVLSALALIFLAPMMLAAAVAIKLQDGGPVLFGQERMGLGGKPFKCWKFRSMVVNAEARLAAVLASSPEARSEWEADHKLRKDPRITMLGRFLRVSSIDELPQLFNIIAGDMSLVGPRPIVPAEVPKYGRWFSRYMSVKPGLTGLWQVSGRNDVSYRERVALDILFAKRSNFKLYVYIIMMTVPAVLKRSGSY